MLISVLVVDDEMLARENIKLLMQSQQDIGPIYEARDGEGAVLLATEYQPDVVILDIQMPGLSGLEVVSHLPENTVIIFATAYDEHAITAFELNAIDYLLKPFDDKRFYDALTKAKRSLLTRDSKEFKEVREMLLQLSGSNGVKFKSRLVVKDPGRIRLIDVEQINFIQGAGNYVEIHMFNEETLLHRETMGALEQQLNPNEFTRIHRSTIVRSSSVCELRPNEHGDYTVFLKSGEQLTLSRRSKGKLEQLLAGDS